MADINERMNKQKNNQTEKYSFRAAPKPLQTAVQAT